MISEESVSRVRDANDIVEVISEYLPNMKRAGKDFKALCPFHQEKTPSFLVSPSKGIFHCFGCGKGGDVFKFIMEIDRCSYPESIEKLAERKGIPLRKDGSALNYSRQHEKKKELLQVTQRAMEYYHKCLLESVAGRQALKYLKETRGLKSGTIEEFKLGWAPPSGRDLRDNALKSGFSEALLAEAGLIFRSKRDGKWMDWFRNRVMFPILDAKGQVIGFGGRVLGTEQQSGENVPAKYLNSPESQVFQKGKNLYGLFQGSKAIREKKEAMIVEGYMDVISCHQAGVKVALAPLGTSLTQEQCKLLKNYADQITLLFDADKAGKMAAARASDLLPEFRTSEQLTLSGFLPMIVLMKEYKDADEYLKNHSPSDFETLLKNRVNAVEFILESVLNAGENLPPALAKSRAAESVLPIIAKIPDPIIRSEMLKSVSERLHVSLESLIAKMGTNPGPAQKLPTSLRPSGILSAEEELISMFVRHPELQAILKDNSFFREHELFTIPQCKEIHDTLKNAGTTATEGGVYAGPHSGWLSEILVKSDLKDENPEKIVREILKRLEQRAKERIRKDLEPRIIEISSKDEEKLTEDERKLRNHYQDLVRNTKGGSVLGRKGAPAVSSDKSIVLEVI